MTEELSNPPLPPANPAPPVESGPAPSGPAWLLAALLVAVTMALYWPVTHYNFVGYDDPFYVTANHQVQTGLSLDNVVWAFTTGTAANWHPLTWLSLMLDVKVFGPTPAGFHFTNVVLHAVDAVLLFWLLRRLTGACWRSFGVAALFAWHPVHVESVAWISERKDVLSAGFGFLALLFYTRYAQGREATSRERGAGVSPWYWLAGVCLALGLMSKPMLVTWPFVLLLLDYWPLERFKTSRVWPLVREKIPFFGLSVAASIVTFLVQKQGGAVVPEAYFPWGSRVGNALVSYVRYLEKMFWPADLSLLYTHAGYWPAGRVLLAVLLLGGLSAWFWIQRRRYPFLLVGWLWYLGTLVPVIGLVQVGEQSMADRYMYIPSVGILVLVVWGVYELTIRCRHQPMMLSVLAVATMAACLVLTRKQMAYWVNTETLFRRALAVTENSYIVRNNFANVLLEQGQYDAAVSQFQEALRLRPDFAPAHYNLGVALDKQGQTDAAVNQLQEALRLRPDDPNIHNNLSSALAKRGETNAAVSQLQEALRLNPNFALAHENLANLFAVQGQIAAAANEYQEALRLEPDNAEAHYNLGGILLEQGQTDAAIHEFQADLLLKPNDTEAHYNLGNLLVRSGQMGAAIDQFQEAIRLQPNDAIGHNNLGLLLTGTGQTAAALSQFQEALRLMPDNAQIHYNFGNSLVKAGQTDAAITEFREALRLKPDFTSAQNNLTKALALKNQSSGPAPGPARQ